MGCATIGSELRKVSLTPIRKASADDRKKPPGNTCDKFYQSSFFFFYVSEFVSGECA